jgi:cytochrome c biogenesis protein CcdA
MNRILKYLFAALGILAGFCLAFTIIVVLITKDGEPKHALTEAWMPYISLILVIALPAMIVWSIFRFGRSLFFKNLRKNPEEDKDE